MNDAAAPRATETAAPAAPAAEANDRPLPVLGGKRSTGKADRTGNPQVDRAVRAAKTAKATATPPATAARARRLATQASAKATEGILNADAAADGPARRATKVTAHRTAAEKNAAAKAAKVAQAPAKAAKVSAPRKAPAAPAVDEAAAAAKAEAKGTRESALNAAKTCATAEEAARHLVEAARHRNDRVEVPAKTKPLAAHKPTAHAIGEEGDHLLCAGACARILPVSRFPYIGPKAAQAGRFVECGRDQVDRLAVNQARKAAELPEVPRPRVTTGLPKDTK